MSDWIKHLGDKCPVDPMVNVEYEMDGDPNTYCDPAGSLFWGQPEADEPGRIVRYRTVGIGSVLSVEPGSAARYNAGKVPLELIPLGILAEYLQFDRSSTNRDNSIAGALDLLGQFQMRRGDVDPETARELLLHVIWNLDEDGHAFKDCARVFDYGRRKYAEWNWAKGQAWSVPIACAARHLALGILRGEHLDPDSGLPHRGHVVCNIVMLLWFMDHYPAGDDRPLLVRAA